VARSARRNEPPLPFPGGSSDSIDSNQAATLLAHVTDLVAVVDAEGEIRHVSGSVERQLGHRADQLIGGPVSQLFVADLDVVSPEVLDRVFLGRGSHGPLPMLALDADGRPRPVEVMVENRLEWGSDSRDATSGVVVVTATDTTAKLIIDAALSEQREILEGIARGAGVEYTIGRLVERVCRWIPDAGALLLLDEPDGGWRTVASVGVPDALAELLEWCDDGSPIGQAFGHLPDRSTVVTMGEPSWFAVRSACRSTGVESFWARSFRGVGADRPAGVLLVVRNDRRHPSTVETDLLEQSAHLAAIAVERQRAMNALEHAAVHDELTGLPNRALVVDRLEQELGRIERVGGGVGVLFVDLDRFKHLNDTYGHTIGDAVLCAVADRLHGVLRGGDTVGRLGGDEFVMVCTGVESPPDVLVVAQRVSEALRSPVLVGGAELRVRASIGVAFAEDGTARAEDLIRNADHAAHRAKEQGRDTVVLFEEADHLRILTRVEIEQALHGAQERDELVLYYQPIMRLSDLRQVGVEALLRWERPGSGLVGPDTFIAVAEDTGLILPIGSWVLEEAFRSAAVWPEPTSGGRIQVSVNLSPRQLSAPGLLDRITGLFERTGVSPRLICFEVTESALMGDEEIAVATLQRLKALGAHVAIDDFGTGHATLDYLRRFDMADVLKIDKSFVAGLDTVGGQERAIIGATVAMAHTLGVEVVAEGVETDEQLRAVTELGCDRAQGYLLGSPDRFVHAVAASASR